LSTLSYPFPYLTAGLFGSALLMTIPTVGASSDSGCPKFEETSHGSGMPLSKEAKPATTYCVEAHRYSKNEQAKRPKGNVSSQRKDHLSQKESWDETQGFTLNDALGLPSWVTLTMEERVRYEGYATPWIKGNQSGQYAVPIQTVVWGEAWLTDEFRLGAEFWDARQYGSSNPDALNNSIVNAGNFSQIYGAYLGRNVFDSHLDSETKAGQMIMDLGSHRLFGYSSYRNVQTNQFVGVQNRIREESGEWDLLTFAVIPENILPNTSVALLHNNVVWNRPQTDTYYTGFMVTKSIMKDTLSELYLFYLSEGPTNPLERKLYTTGFRVNKSPKKGEYDFELETIGQTGSARISSTANIESVGSVMQHVSGGYTFNLPWDPRLLLQWDYSSSHFDSLYSTTSFEYGPNDILGFFTRNNLNTPGYHIYLEPDHNISIMVANRFWWLADSGSTMGWAAAKLVDTSGKSGSYLGQTWELNVRWNALDNVQFQAGMQILMKGQFALYAPGAPTDHSNVDFFYTATEFHF